MKKKILIPIVLVVIAAGAGWFFVSRRSNQSATELTLQGNVDIRDVNLGFRVGGRLAAMAVDEGDSVKAGDVLAKLDPAPYEREVQNAQAQVDGLRAHLALLKAGYRNEDIDQAKATLAARDVALANAERQWKRQSEMRGTGATAEKAYDDALAARDQAAAQSKLAAAALALVQAGYRPEEISQAQANLAAGEAALAAAKLKLDDTVLRAPSDGVILTRASEPGAILSSGATVYTLTLTHPVWVRAYVNETDLGRIHPGEKVAVRTDTHPDHPYEGQIGFISPEAEFTPKPVETTELRTGLVYRLRIVVQNPDDGLRQGMPVTAQVSLNATKTAER